MSQVNIQRSIRWQLDNLTPQIVTRFCEAAGLEPMTPTELAEWWDDWSWEGLECLLLARSEEPIIEIEV